MMEKTKLCPLEIDVPAICSARTCTVCELQAAMLKAWRLLGAMSGGVDGSLRRQICTAYNILGKPLGKERSSHGDAGQE